MKPVGYLTNYASGMEGEWGICYDYVLAANGVFIEAKGNLISGRLLVADCNVRGLAPLESQVTLQHGRIPQRFFDLAMNCFLIDTFHERYVAVTWENGYQFYAPQQKADGTHVEYLTGDNIMLDLHSHGQIPAWFSTKDNTDEAGMKLYGVVGGFGKTPVVKLRVGIYGYFFTMSWNDIFDGSLTGAVEYEEEPNISTELLNDAYNDSGVTETLREDIENELHDRDIGQSETT